MINSEHNSAYPERDQYSALLGEGRFFLQTRESQDSFPFNMPFEGLHRLEWWRSLSLSKRFEVRLIRTFVLDLLSLDNLEDVPNLFSDDETKANLNRSIIIRITNMLGIEGTIEEREKLVIEAFHDADSVIRMFDDPTSGLLSDLRSKISMINEITGIHNPVDLLMILFSSNYSTRAKFEALRKLILADLSLRLKRHEESSNGTTALDPFMRFLHTHIWKNSCKGELKQVELVSTHDPEDYSCQSYKILEHEGQIVLDCNQRYHKLNMRICPSEVTGGRPIHVMMDHRIKDPASYVLKMIRKNSKDPDTIDDGQGLKLVLQNEREIFRLLEILQKTAALVGSAISFDQIKYSMGSEEFRPDNPGSTKKLSIAKVHLLFNGTLIELQIHTFQSYINHLLTDETAWDEYSIRRLFLNGHYSDSVFELLYPQDIYNVDPIDYCNFKLRQMREAKRAGQSYIPPDRRPQPKEDD